MDKKLVQLIRSKVKNQNTNLWGHKKIRTNITKT
jgi:hypothetical protein